MFRGVTDEISSHLRITLDGPIIFVPVQVFCLKLFCNILVPWVCGWRILRYLFYINMSACPESNLQRLVYYQQEKKEQRSQKKAYFRFFVERHKTWSFQKCKCSQTGRNFPHYLRFFLQLISWERFTLSSEVQQSDQGGFCLRFYFPHDVIILTGNMGQLWCVV